MSEPPADPGTVWLIRIGMLFAASLLTFRAALRIRRERSVSYRIARPLADGLRNRVVVTSDEVQRLMPVERLPPASFP